MTTPLKYLADINPPTTEFARLPSDAMVSFVPLECVWRDGLRNHSIVPICTVSTGYTRFRDGDLVVPKITPTFQADRSVIVSHLHGGLAAGTTELHVVRSHTSANARYLRYVLSSHQFLLGGESEMIGVAGQKRVPDEWLRSFQVAHVDIGQQRAIADYLDAETARIDALTTKKQHMVELLNERVDGRIRALIGQSKLVNGSGQSVELKRLIRKLDRKPVENEMITAFRNGVVTARAKRRPEGYTESWTENARVQGVRDGDVVIHGLDGFAGAIGTSDIDGICSPVYHVCEPLDGGDPLYYGRLLRLLAVDGYLGLFASSTRERAVDFRNWGMFGRIPVPAMPIDEQERIGATIAKIVRLQDAIERSIGPARERRQALITAAVTGEFRVPGAA